MKVTRDIVVKMVEHGSFDHFPPQHQDAEALPQAEIMATQIGKVYKLVYESVLNAGNSSQLVIEKTYQVDNQT